MERLAVAAERGGGVETVDAGAEHHAEETVGVVEDGTSPNDLAVVPFKPD